MEYAWVPDANKPINEVLVYREWVDELEYLVKMAGSVNIGERDYGLRELRQHIRGLRGL